MYRIFPLIALLTTLVASSASAAPIALVHDSDSLASIDLATGAVAPIGSFGIALGMTDIAVSPAGAAYGISFGNLYAIDLSTGAAGLIGAHGISSANSLGFGSDGTLYAASASSSRLWTIDTTSAASTWITTTQSNFTAGGDVEESDGILYLTTPGLSSDLWRVDPDDITAFPIARIGVEIGAIGFPNMRGLAGTSSALYGFSGRQVIEIDRTTGAGSLLYDFSSTQSDLALAGVLNIEGATLLAIPEPSSALLLSLGLLLLPRATRHSGRERG